MAVVDVEAIHAALEFARAEIGRALGPALGATYERLSDDAPYAPEAAAMGRRALRNVCLSYLVATGAEAAVALAKAQFDAGRNMTDVLAALGLLADLDRPEREAALAAFYERWRHDPLVLDQWFAMQARSTLAGTLERCRALLAHPDFTLHNPNRARALIGNFAMGNPLRFHAASGEGYAFLADQVRALDGINGQIAARLVAPLGAWRRHDAARGALMRRALERILAAPGLSKGSFEMASKSLDSR
jgi:aminopeptidase N